MQSDALTAVSLAYCDSCWVCDRQCRVAIKTKARSFVISCWSLTYLLTCSSCQSIFGVVPGWFARPVSGSCSRFVIDKLVDIFMHLNSDVQDGIYRECHTTEALSFMQLCESAARMYTANHALSVMHRFVWMYSVNVGRLLYFVRHHHTWQTCISSIYLHLVLQPSCWTVSLLMVQTIVCSIDSVVGCSFCI